MAELERSERLSSQIFANAMDDLKAGRTDAAIRGFRRVTIDEPTSYSAHFQLATLLQDVQKDYVGAISHYRLYLAMRPKSDKATLADDRIRRCWALLEAEVLSRASSADSAQIEIARLRKERETLVVRVKALEASLAKSEKEVAALAQQKDSLSALLRKFSESDAAGKPRALGEAIAALKEKDEAERRRRISPPDEDLLDDGEDEAPTVAGNKSTVNRFRDEMEKEEREDAAKPQAKTVARQSTRGGTSTNGTASVSRAGGFDGIFGGSGRGKSKARLARPDTYCVQEGDTLFALALRFYGTQTAWRKIRDANRAVISSDGRLRVGQTIKLP